MMFDEGVKLRLGSDVRFRSIMGEGVLLRQEEGEVLVVNEVGARVLEEIDGTRSTRDILERLGSEYDVQREELQAHVIEYLAQLAADGVVVASTDP